MRRGLLVVCLAAAFLGAGLAGFLAATRLGPQHLEGALERAASSALGTSVELGSASLSLDAPWPILRIEALDASGWPDEAGSGLEVRRIHARIDPVAWWVGRPMVQEIVFEGAAFHPARFARPPNTPPAPTSDQPWVDQVLALDGLADALRNSICPLPPILVQGGEITSPNAAEPLVDDLQGSIACVGSGTPDLLLSARTPEDGEIRIRLGPGEEEESIDGEFTLEEVELSRWGWAIEPFELTGRVTGRIGWQSSPEAPHLISLGMRGPSVQVGVPRSGTSPWRTRLPWTAVRVELAASRTELTLGLAEWLDHGLRLRAEGSLALPLGDHSELRLALATDRLDLREALRRIAGLPDEVREPLEFGLDRLEGGELTNVRVETQTTISDWNELVAGRIFGRSGAVSLDLGVQDASIRLGAADRIEAVHGRFLFRGDDLEVQGFRGMLRGERLPRIDARVSGLTQIHGGDELACVTPLPVPPLPGLEELQAWVRSRREEPREPTWTRARIEADWVSHPALLCTIEQAEVEIVPGPGRASLRLRRGVWAGLPISAEAEVLDGPHGDWHAGEITATVRLGPPFEGMQPSPPQGAWARGRFEVDATQVGTWSVHGGRGNFEARGARLDVTRGSLALRPGGRVGGRIGLDLGSATPLRYDASLEIPAVPMEQLWASAGVDSPALTGTLHGAIGIEGTLIRGEPPLEEATGSYSLQGRDGVVFRKLPVLLAITVASDRWNPFGQKDRLPYDAIDVAGEVRGGDLHADILTVDAPTFRLGASGTIGVSEPHPVEAVFGMFLFPTLDRVIDRVPLLGRVLLGSNRNLVGAYFNVGGQVATPTARIIPVKSLTSMGPANLMLEGLPEFVRGGIQRIQSVLRPRAGTPPPSKEKADS